MTKSDFIIREIKPEDNLQIAQVIRSVLIEFGAPKVGTAYEDKATDTVFENYNIPTSAYYVVTYKNKIVGGAGFAKLDNHKGNTCELQKMYFLPIARNLGLGSLLISTCLNEAKKRTYKNCYLETMPYMEAAQKLYKKNGFTNLEGPIGNTGHYSCNVWMLKKL